MDVLTIQCGWIGGYPLPAPVIVVSGGGTGGQTTYRKRNIFQERTDRLKQVLQNMARLERERVARIQQDDEEILRILMDE